MAVGYEKLNSSAARSRRRHDAGEPSEKPLVIKRGTMIWNATFGNGTTLDEFVSECDRVRCEFAGGLIVTMRGGAVMVGINDRIRKDSQINPV